MSATHDAVVAAWREQAPRLVGALLRITRDLELAQDVAQEAMQAALEQWPDAGVPHNPAAWLMTVARRRAIDHLRRSERAAVATTDIGNDLRTREDVVLDLQINRIEDDVLRLMMMTCHPALTPESQIALTLRLVGGLTSTEIARAFMVPEATVVRRITRAKTALAEVARRLESDQPFDVPEPDERRRRLPAVLHVIYLIFTEGYAASAGDDVLRPALCDEAIRLGRLTAQLFDDDAEVHGLLALMYFQSSRIPARTDPDGDPVLLADQDRKRWDQLAIRRGSDALDRAFADGPEGGYYTLQAAIAACHAVAPSVEQTDWPVIAGLYDTLIEISPSPVVLLNRAIAHGRVRGPEAGLELVEELVGHPGLRDYHLLPSVRGDFLVQLGRPREAAEQFERAAALATNGRSRAFLLRRAEEARTDSRD